MKRLIAAVVLIIIIFAINTLGFAVTEHYYDTLTTILEDCRRDYENGDKKSAAEKAADLEELFEKSEKKLAVFVNRGSIDDIGASVTQIRSFAESQADSLFLSEVSLCLMYVEHMHDIEQEMIY